MPRRYYLLRSNPGEPGLLKELNSVFDRIARQHSRRFQYGHRQSGAEGLVQHVYIEPEQTDTISLIEDAEVPARYLQIEADSEEAANQLGQWLIESLPVVPLAELQQDARNAIEDDPQKLVRLALGAGSSADRETAVILQQGFISPDDLVRFRAAQGMALTSWPIFAPVLREHSRNDPSPEVREMSRRALEACEQEPPADEAK